MDIKTSGGYEDGLWNDGGSYWVRCGSAPLERKMERERGIRLTELLADSCRLWWLEGEFRWERRTEMHGKKIAERGRELLRGRRRRRRTEEKGERLWFRMMLEQLQSAGAL